MNWIKRLPCWFLEATAQKRMNFLPLLVTIMRNDRLIEVLMEHPADTAPTRSVAHISHRKVPTRSGDKNIKE